MYMAILHVEWLLYYQRCLYSVLELNMRYNWWVMAPNTHCSLFLISHLCVLLHICWKQQVIHVYGCSAYQTTALLSKTFLVWFWVAWEIWLKSYGPRHMSVVLWHNILCLYCKPIHICTSLFGAQLRMIMKLTYIVPYDCILNTKWRLYLQWHIVLKEQIWLATLHVVVSFESILYANIKITKYHHTSLWVWCQAATKSNIN